MPVESICIEVRDGEKVLVVEEESDSIRLAFADGALVLGVAEVDGAEESLLGHDLLL